MHLSTETSPHSKISREKLHYSAQPHQAVRPSATPPINFPLPPASQPTVQPAFEIENPSFSTTKTKSGNLDSSKSFPFQSNNKTPRKTVHLGKRKERPFFSIDSREKKKSKKQSLSDDTIQTVYQQEPRGVLHTARTSMSTDVTNAFETIADKLKAITDYMGERVSAHEIWNINNILRSQGFNLIRRSTKLKTTLLAHLAKYKK